MLVLLCQSSRGPCAVQFLSVISNGCDYCERSKVLHGVGWNAVLRAIPTITTPPDTTEADPKVAACGSTLAMLQRLSGTEIAELPADMSSAIGKFADAHTIRGTTIDFDLEGQLARARGGLFAFADGHTVPARDDSTSMLDRAVAFIKQVPPLVVRRFVDCLTYFKTPRVSLCFVQYCLVRRAFFLISAQAQIRHVAKTKLAESAEDAARRDAAGMC